MAQSPNRGTTRALRGPAPTFKCESGVCGASDRATQGLFKGLQRALNAYLEKYTQWPTIAVDGVVGPETAAAFRIVAQHMAENNLRRAAEVPTSPEGLAPLAESWGREIAKVAGATWNPSDADDEASGTPWWVWLMGGAAVVGVGVGAYYLWQRQGAPRGLAKPDDDGDRDDGGDDDGDDHGGGAERPGLAPFRTVIDI